MPKTIAFDLTCGLMLFADLEHLILLGVKCGGMIARAEYSGSEGCYVEVAAWNAHASPARWERLAFAKFFENELVEGLSAEETAQLVADIINKRVAFAALPFISNLPGFSTALPEIPRIRR